MNGKFKAIGLALIAVLALSAFSATAAQGAEVTAGAYPATLTGKDVKTKHGELARLTIGNGARYVECESASLSATLAGPAGQTEVSVSPSYAGCFSNGLTAVPATVTVNGCTFKLHATTKTEGQATVVCPEGKQIEVHVYENHTKHTENKPICTYDIAAQGPITGAKLGVINSGAANEGISVNLAELAKFNVTSTMGPLSVCGVNGTSGHAATTGSLRGEYHVTGTSGGVATKVMLQ
ncbi:MAG TPA: hypothetical protein VEW07_07865 [Solirubrobacterales bacterium]|nr:hypothetical protein [Solirubrobacterales bacterium]